jgi:hypothetical protein
VSECNCGVVPRRADPFASPFARACGACQRDDHANCSHTYACTQSARGKEAANVRANGRLVRDAHKRIGIGLVDADISALGVHLSPEARSRLRQAHWRWARTLHLWEVSNFSGTWWIGRLRRPTRLFLAGDLVLGTWMNGGGERQPVWGRSSRGFDVVHYYVQYARYQGWPKNTWERDNKIPKWQNEALYKRPCVQCMNFAPVEVLALPGALADIKSPADPVVRAYVLDTLCAGDAASPVSADSRVSSTQGEAPPS